MGQGLDLCVAHTAKQDSSGPPQPQRPGCLLQENDCVQTHHSPSHLSSPQTYQQPDLPEGEGLETEFSHMAKDPIHHTYVMKPHKSSG